MFLMSFKLVNLEYLIKIIHMKSIIKFGLKSAIALFVIGIGTKLGKDAIEDLKQFQDDRKNINHGKY